MKEIKPINLKIAHLDEYLRGKYNVSLARTIGEPDKRIEKIIKGANPSFIVVNKITKFFGIDASLLKDDELALPEDEDLVLDEEFMSALEADSDNSVKLFKNKHSISNAYKMLGHGKRVSLWLSCLGVGIPVVAFVLACFILIIDDRNSTLEKYKYGNASEEATQLKYKEIVDNKTSSTYANVKIGTEIEGISSIDHSDNSYVATMSTWFDFDQIEFHEMFYRMDEGKIFNEDGFYTDADLKADKFTVASDGSTYLSYGDNIPDVIQFNFASGIHPSSDTAVPLSVSTLYSERESKAFPGEQQSNNFSDKNSEFYIGNGSFVADSVEYREGVKNAYKAEDGTYRYFQKVHFDARIGKTFDSPRYPLDSVQFHIYIQPNRNVDYIRYVNADEVYIDNELAGYNGLSTNFGISNGYRLISTKKGLQDVRTRVYYYESNEAHSESLDNMTQSQIDKLVIKTELEITIRANKSGISSFIQAFINIFAVGIWMIIAFFNQSFNKVDSISMIGTGLFAAISSVLVGISMISDANIFSLITMINIFTLAIILVMAYESIATKRASVKESQVAMAYRTIKLRVIFYILLVCSLIMFIALPLSAYIFVI